MAFTFRDDDQTVFIGNVARDTVGCNSDVTQWHDSSAARLPHSEGPLQLLGWPQSPHTIAGK